MLFQYPVTGCIPKIEAYIQYVFDKHSFPLSNIMERVVFAATGIAKGRDFNCIASGIEMFYRQLQRDFQSMLGLSLKEYCFLNLYTAI
jgi:hypothetical protein